jgi:hypothetical protein
MTEITTYPLRLPRSPQKAIACSSLLVPICPEVPCAVRFGPKSSRVCPKLSVRLRFCPYRSASDLHVSDFR